MFISALPLGDNDSDGNSVGNLEKIAALTGFTHAMADCLLASDIAFTEFCDLMEIDEDGRADMHETVTVAHDVLLSMSARAQSELAVAKLASVLRGNPWDARGGEDDNEDNPVIRIPNPGL